MNARRRSGMTLIEVMVALTIAGIALAAGAAVLGFLTDQQTRAIGNAVTRPASIRASLRDWIAGAQLTTAGDVRFAGSRLVDAANRSYSSLEFVTSAPTPVAAGGDATTRVKLVFAPATGNVPAQLVAELSPFPAGQPIVLPIRDSISAFDIRYRANVSRASPWIDSWVSTSVLPAIVEIHISAPREDLLTVPLAVLVGERR